MLCAGTSLVLTPGWEGVHIGRSPLWPLPKTVTQIHSSILHLGSQRAFRAVLRTRIVPQATGLGAQERHIPSLLLHMGVSLNRTIWGWGTSVTSQIPEKNILAQGTRWRTETVVAKPQHPSCHTARTNSAAPSPSPSPSTGAIPQWFVMYWNAVYIAKSSNTSLESN